MTQVIFGLVNPSGRLPVTFPNRDNEVGFTPEQFPGVPPCPKGVKACTQRAHYTEGLLVGYRWYDFHNVRPQYSFGHGVFAFPVLSALLFAPFSMLTMDMWLCWLTV